MADRSVSGLSANTFRVGAGNMFADMSTEMLTPVLPIFLTQVLGAGGSIVGLVDGIAQAIRNLIDGFSGPISDKLQNRKLVALAGYAMSAAAKPLMGLSTSWEGVLATRSLDRLGAGTRSAPRDAIVASSVDKRHRGAGFGVEGFGENAGACLGPIVTGLLLYVLQADIRTVFYMAFVPGLLALSIMCFIRDRPRAGIARPATTVSPRELPGTYWKYLLAVGIFSIGNSSNAFLILRSQEVGASILITLLIYAGFNFVAALVSYPLSSLSDRWGRKTVLLGSCFVFLAAYAGFALAQSIVEVIGFFLIYGIYQGSFRTVGRALASDLTPERLRASGIGWFSTTLGLCQLTASLIAGAFWDRLGHTSVFLYGIASALAGILAIALLLPRGRDDQHG